MLRSCDSRGAVAEGHPAAEPPPLARGAMLASVLLLALAGKPDP